MATEIMESNASVAVNASAELQVTKEGKGPPTSGKYCDGCQFDSEHENPNWDRHCDKYGVQLVATDQGTVRCNFCREGDPKVATLKDGESFKIECPAPSFVEFKRSGDVVTVEFSGKLQATLTI